MFYILVSRWKSWTCRIGVPKYLLRHCLLLCQRRVGHHLVLWVKEGPWERSWIWFPVGQYRGRVTCFPVIVVGFRCTPEQCRKVLLGKDIFLVVPCCRVEIGNDTVNISGHLSCISSHGKVCIDVQCPEGLYFSSALRINVARSASLPAISALQKST